jgi:hypothetical protein
MELAPIVTKAVVVRVATPPLSATVPRWLAPLWKFTVPVGLDPVTVAVKVTDVPEAIVLALDVKVVVVGAMF